MKQNIYEKLRPDPDGFNVFEEQVLASQIPESYFENEQSLSADNNNTFDGISFVPPRYDPNVNYYALFWKNFL